VAKSLNLVCVNNSYLKVVDIVSIVASNYL
jgi:hypothetical protein